VPAPERVQITPILLARRRCCWRRAIDRRCTARQVGLVVEGLEEAGFLLEEHAAKANATLSWPST
jgi:hypothetical protein